MNSGHRKRCRSVAVSWIIQRIGRGLVPGFMRGEKDVALVMHPLGDLSAWVSMLSRLPPDPAAIPQIHLVVYYLERRP